VTKSNIKSIALDYGGTLGMGDDDPVLGQKGVDPRAAAALHQLAGLGIRLILASNATASETRWPALHAAGVHHLFSAGLISYALQIRKPDPLFYDLVITAASCPASMVLFAGNSLTNDIAGPMRAGMQACLIRPRGLVPGEHLPDGVMMLGHIAELPELLGHR
jgi:FMN phosphatase YigB (HAD superfamily)